MHTSRKESRKVHVHTHDISNIVCIANNILEQTLQARTVVGRWAGKSTGKNEMHFHCVVWLSGGFRAWAEPFIVVLAGTARVLGMYVRTNQDKVLNDPF